MSIIRDEIRDDYRRMAGIELSDAEVTEMAWQAALETAADDGPELYRVLVPAEIEAAWQEAGHDWQDEYRWETGPGPGYDDTPEHNDRIHAPRQRATTRMKVQLPVYQGGYREYEADLTTPQAAALRGLTLEPWIQCMATHADRQLKVGHGPFTLIATDTDDRAHIFRLETDGSLVHTGPRD